MLTPEKKRMFLEGWLRRVGAEGETKELHDSLYQLLLNDTNMSGKLYKYRSFDKKGRSLKSLKTGTLYCACPASFNDPFDCKIGVTISSLAEAVMAPCLDVTNEIIAVFLSILSGERTIERCNEDERAIINRLLENKKVMSFIEEIKKTTMTDVQIAKLLKADPTIFVEFLHAVIADEFFSSMLGPLAKMVPLILEKVPDEELADGFTHTSMYEALAQAVGIDTDADEIDLSIRLSEKMFPEQEREREAERAILNDLEQQLIVKINTLFRVGCLCTDFKNALMWSHYADSHKGFCVEYDFSCSRESSPTTLPMPVIYSESRPQIPWGAALHRSAENTASATTDLMFGLLTKDEHWDYENEWRFLIPATMNPNLQMPPISCIYLGAMITPKNRSKILKFAKKQGIPVKKMVVDRGAYSLHAIMSTDE